MGSSSSSRVDSQVTNTPSSNSYNAYSRPTNQTVINKKPDVTYGFQPTEQRNLSATKNPLEYKDLSTPTVVTAKDLFRPSVNTPYHMKQQRTAINVQYNAVCNVPLKKDNRSDNKSCLNEKSKQNTVYAQHGSSFCDPQTTTFVVEEHHDKNYIVNKISSTNVISSSSRIQPPSKFLNIAEFESIWLFWKEQFLTYMKSIDPMESKKQQWDLMLLNLMGPIGQQIDKIYGDNCNQDIDKLLEKFDRYHMFKDKHKRHNEEIDVYVNRLKVIASQHTTEPDKIVKKEILKEIDKDKFISSAKMSIPEFSSLPSILSLTLKEITYIWMKYSNVDFKKSEIIEDLLVRNCNNCGDSHVKNKCPAYNKTCNKCGIQGHYWMRCPSQYFSNCLYCGEGHFMRQCPAYWNECRNCLRMHHFSWKCTNVKRLKCSRCGLIHASKAACPVVNVHW